MRYYLLQIILLCTVALPVCAQINDDFTDANFTSNPVWTGNMADWAVNASLQLQSNNTIAGSIFYLSTANTLASNTQWEFYCNLNFNPSGTNYADVYLTASAADISLPSTTGYFVRIGNTADEICLYKKDATGLATKIIDGADGILNSGNNILKIKVIHNAANVWSLARDVTGTGNNYFLEGTSTDASYNTSAFFGILIKQSTASFFQRHFFDDIEVKPYVPDVTAPTVSAVTATSSNTADVLFNEPVDMATAQQTLNYFVGNAIGFPASAIRDAANTSLIHLTFSNSFPNRTTLTLSINNVTDISGNTIASTVIAFVYFTAVQYDVVIDELMADPTPAVQLPPYEWLEIKNNTTFTIDLQNWKLGKSTGQSNPMPAYSLAPGGYVILCAGSAAAALAAYGPVLAITGFPALNNDVDEIYLRSPQGIIVHSVNYTDAWYKNELKKDGGWTLEMKDPKNPCTGADNWAASTSVKGGTPAAQNSINAVNADVTLPKLLSASAQDATHISLLFNEPVDSVAAAAPTNYLISDGIGMPIAAMPVAIGFERVNLVLQNALTANKIYTVTASAIKDCSGNSIGAGKTARVGLYERMDSNDVVINEILFNPKINGTDYIEFYNRSKKILNLKNAFVASRNSGGSIASIAQISSENYLFFPGDYIVLTEDPSLVKRDFVANEPDRFIKIKTMPSFNDDAGVAILLNEQGTVTDELKYSEKWHFALIDNNEGVALERINPDAATVQGNFHSAATNVGYGTPTYKNSQYRTDAGAQGDVTVSPSIVSPDNDGIDDVATVQYNFPEPGYVANITIYDATGRPVRYLQRNALAGLKGFFRWDGLGEKQQKLLVGLYIIYTEIFNLQGKTKKFKNTIVLARRQ